MGMEQLRQEVSISGSINDPKEVLIDTQKEGDLFAVAQTSDHHLSLEFLH